MPVGINGLQPTSLPTEMPDGINGLQPTSLPTEMPDGINGLQPTSLPTYNPTFFSECNGLVNNNENLCERLQSISNKIDFCTEYIEYNDIVNRECALDCCLIRESLNENDDDESGSGSGEEDINILVESESGYIIVLSSTSHLLQHQYQLLIQLHNQLLV